jgi:hypothetical protein
MSQRLRGWEMGREWILKEAMVLAAAEGLRIENMAWEVSSRDKEQAEERLCFDLNGRRHFVRFSEEEIDECSAPAYESVRSLVAQRLRETFRRMKREISVDPS